MSTTHGRLTWSHCSGRHKTENRPYVAGESASPEAENTLNEIKKIVSSHIKENKRNKRARSEQSSPQKEKGKKIVKGAEE
ncbi:hypothetical protein PILCRDRAFT_17558 [Piloderma croceum F 1598]|uniref:Uncharacterized protein n=1 Tax=Piloderma croceum (strain F 1598) TaxID=765440 RepID=A0A0C3AB09_PILCF|nr:hypothetical protein PILCRDRAFT_17558 [Piloderma croceum F 1598]